MRHAVVHDPPTWGRKAIILALLKLTALAMFLIAILAFPALSQRVYPVPMPALRESNPVTVMQLEAARVVRDSVSRQDSIRAQQRLPDIRIPVLRMVEIQNEMSRAIPFDVGSLETRPEFVIVAGADADIPGTQ
jgi:hypothetical protein